MLLTLVCSVFMMSDRQPIGQAKSFIGFETEQYEYTKAAMSGQDVFAI